MKKVSLILITALVTSLFLSSCDGGPYLNEAAPQEKVASKEEISLKEKVASKEETSLKEKVASKEVTIGKQVWMTENLNVDKFRNGEAILEVKTPEEWFQAYSNKQPCWCYYENDPVNGAKYGKLYNSYAVTDSRGLAPTGWHVPSDDEWGLLTQYLEDKPGDKLKSTSGWKENGNGTNSSGFSGLPGGFLNSYGLFLKIGLTGGWWSSVVGRTGRFWDRSLKYSDGLVYRASYYENEGLSVRCLRD